MPRTFIRTVTCFIAALAFLGWTTAIEQNLMMETSSATKIESDARDTLPRMFPELVGLDGEEARAKLREEYPSQKLLSNIVVLPENSMTTRDYRIDRVRIFVDGNGKVAKTPHIG